jgi:hypothetical protein
MDEPFGSNNLIGVGNEVTEVHARHRHHRTWSSTGLATTWRREDRHMLTDRLIHPRLHELAALQAEHEQRLMALPNVVGVAVGHKVTDGRTTGTPCVSVLVDMKLGEGLLNGDDMIPKALGSAPTDVLEVGILQAGTGAPLIPQSATGRLDGTAHDHDGADGTDNGTPLATSTSREQFAAHGHQPLAGAMSTASAAERVRPVMGGTSIGHFRGTAGSLGICCHDTMRPILGVPQRFYLLSNNHVLANCNEASVGDAILQPAPVDGGRIFNDIVARLTRFVPIKFTIERAPFSYDTGSAPINYVDAAIAEGRFAQLDRRIHWIGDLRHGSPLAEIGATVQKCGRTSNYTTGTILAVNATVSVNYPGGRIARFAKQIITNAMATGGDSGAIIVDLEQRALGLLFATSTAIAIASPISLVEQLLDIRVTQPTNGSLIGRQTVSH